MNHTYHYVRKGCWQMSEKSNERYVLDLLKRLYGFEALPSDLSSEAVVLYREELDEDLLPSYFDEVQTDEEMLIYYYAINEYLVYIITDLTDYKWQLVGILKENQLVHSFIPDY